MLNRISRPQFEPRIAPNTASKTLVRRFRGGGHIVVDESHRYRSGHSRLTEDPDKAHGGWGDFLDTQDD